MKMKEVLQWVLIFAIIAFIMGKNVPIISDIFTDNTEETTTTTIDPSAPVLSGVYDINYLIGDPTPNYLYGVTATDDVDTSLTVLYDASQVSLTVVGSYPLVYSVTDSDGNLTTVTVYVHVTDGSTTTTTASDSLPTFSGIVNYNLTTGDLQPDYLSGVTASDTEDGDLTASITVDSSTVDTSVSGTYTITYSVTDSYGNTTTATATVTVSDPNTAPTISGVVDHSFTIGGTQPDYLNGVTASDTEDGDLTASLTVDDSQVDYATAGTYTAYISVTDSGGLTTTVNSTVTVS